jgi:light-regulated signal transduction histidine kinase (bacteriophytochrome)
MTLLFQNLIGNAIKYRTEKTPCIQISATNDDNHWLFSIKDNGLGIDPKQSDNVFKIFRRLHSNEEYEGTGLAITKRIIERHECNIWVESKLGKGSTFYFTLLLKITKNILLSH